MQYAAVIFDLDGTLLDSLPDIARAANTVLVEYGFAAHTLDSYRQFIGEGVARLFAQALPVDQSDAATIERCIGRFRDAYMATWNVATEPYDGIRELLGQLVEWNVQLAVLSNKPDEFARRCVQHYFCEYPFEIVEGGRDGVPRKPDPTAAIGIARRLRLDCRRCAYVGDTAVDMKTAASAQMYAMGAAWGYRDALELLQAGAQRVLYSPGELISILESGDFSRN